MTFLSRYTVYPEIQIKEVKGGHDWVSRLIEPQKQDPQRNIFTTPGIPDKEVNKWEGHAPCKMTDVAIIKLGRAQARQEAIDVRESTLNTYLRVGD